MIQSVERAALILGALGSGTPRLGVTEIAERVGLAKPTGHGQVQPGPGRPPARQRLPRRVGTAGTFAAVGGVSGSAGERGGVGRDPVRVAGYRAAPRVPPG